MAKELKKGCVVFMKSSSGLVGYGNAQCVKEVHHESLGTISLYGHNQHYKTYDIDKIVEYPDEELKATIQHLTADLKAKDEENAKLKEHCDNCPLLKGSHDVSKFYPDEQDLKGDKNHADKS